MIRSTGFILEGFPRTENETRYLADSGLFPDCTILLAVEDTDIVDRLLPPLLEKWRKKRDKRVAEKERLKALAKKEKVSLFDVVTLCCNYRLFQNCGCCYYHELYFTKQTK